MKIENITISLHTGLKDKMEKQVELLKPLNDKIDIHWNNRYDRHPTAYSSYSEMVNEAVCTSPTEFIILMNDRVVPSPEEVLELVKLLEDGFAISTRYSVGFMGVSKEVFRTVGWWDERYLGGGFEDDDYVLRLRMANLAYYESSLGIYDKSFKTSIRIQGGDACRLSAPHFYRKWRIGANEIVRVIPEEKYEKWNIMIGEHSDEVSNNWMKWNNSILGIGSPPFGKPTETQGESRSYWFMNYETGEEFKTIRSS